MLPDILLIWHDFSEGGINTYLSVLRFVYLCDRWTDGFGRMTILVLNPDDLPNHNEGWNSTKYPEIENMHWSEVAEIFLPELNMKWGADL